MLTCQKRNPEAQYAPVTKFYVCRQPFLQRNNTSAHSDGLCTSSATTFTVDPDEGWCYWRKPTDNCVLNRQSVCSTASDEDGRLCACNNIKNVEYEKKCPSPLLKRNDEGAKVGTDDHVDDSNGDGDDDGDRIVRTATVLSQGGREPHCQSAATMPAATASSVSTLRKWKWTRKHPRS